MTTIRHLDVSIDCSTWIVITVLTADQPIAVRRKGRQRKVMGGGYNGVRR